MLVRRVMNRLHRLEERQRRCREPSLWRKRNKHIVNLIPIRCVGRPIPRWKNWINKYVQQWQTRCTNSCCFEVRRCTNSCCFEVSSTCDQIADSFKKRLATLMRFYVRKHFLTWCMLYHTALLAVVLLGIFFRFVVLRSFTPMRWLPFCGSTQRSTSWQPATIR